MKLPEATTPKEDSLYKRLRSEQKAHEKSIAIIKHQKNDIICLRKFNAELQAIVDSLRATFHHTHSSAGMDGDSCAECGLDLRNPIHRQSKNGH